MSNPPNIGWLTTAELRTLVLELLERVSALGRVVAEQRDEIPAQGAQRPSTSSTAFTEERRRIQRVVRGLIWWFYRDLLAFRRDHTARRRAEMRARFERIFKRETGFVMLDRLLKRLHAIKAGLLAVLDRPEIPLHTNGSENDIRCQVTKRKISGGTRSGDGRACRDAFLGLAKTSRELGVSFWDDLGDRLAVPDVIAVPPLPGLIRKRTAPARAPAVLPLLRTIRLKIDNAG